MSDLLTLDQLVTLPGSVLAVSLVVQAVGYLAGESAVSWLRYVALAVSVMLAVLPVLLALPAVHWSAWVLAVFNAAVIFLAAVGAQTIAAPPPEQSRITTLEAAPIRRRRSWVIRWL